MATARSQFRRRYTDQQKAAFLHAVLVEDMKVTVAVKLAAEGKLGGLPAFHLKLKSAYAIKRKERADFEQHNAVAMAKGSDDATVKLWAKLIKHARELERSDTVDVDEFKRVAVALAAIKRAMGDVAKPPKARGGQTNPTQENTNGSESPSEDVLAQLLRTGKTTSQSHNGHVMRGTEQGEAAYSPSVAATSEGEGPSEGAGRLPPTRTE